MTETSKKIVHITYYNSVITMAITPLHAHPLTNLFQYKNHAFIKTTTECITLSVLTTQHNFNYSYYDIQLDRVT